MFRPRDTGELKMRWHYTVGGHLQSIYAAGFIYPEPKNLMTPGGRPHVWFTSSPVWEETANKGWRVGNRVRCLTREETAALCGGLFRFGVGDDYPLHPFTRILRESKEQPWVGRGLLEIALEVGSNPVRDWWGAVHPVPCEQWKALEHFTPEGWRLFTDVEKIMRGELGAAP